MTKIAVLYQQKGYMVIIADYGKQQMHRHLASHIILSLGEEMRWQVGEQEISCFGICVKSDLVHMGTMPKEGAVSIFFPPLSNYAYCLEQKYLIGKEFVSFSKSEVEEILAPYHKKKREDGIWEKEMLCLLGLNDISSPIGDPRVQKIVGYLNEVDTVEKNIMETLSKEVYLSKSRMSHLFKEETHISLHSYLSYIKMEKAVEQISHGKSITESSLEAGFDSSSHFAATCKRMFGISISSILKNSD